MRAHSAQPAILALFGEILSYPTGTLVASATSCAARLSATRPEAAKDMQAFASFAEQERLGVMEEIYTRTFDITPTTTLYAGYHLFGETYKRGAFLVRLQQEYEKYGFSFGTELADHMSVLLRFAGIANDPEFVNPLIEECILPVLGKIEEAFQGGKNGYWLAVKSLASFLEQEFPSQSRGESCEPGTRGAPLSTLDSDNERGLPYD